MKNSNIIISVIIVLCIAAGVTAYSITNPDSSIFSLPGYTPSDSDNTGDLNAGENGINNGTTTNESGSDGSGVSGSSGSSSSSGGSGSSSSSGSGSSNVHIGMTSSQAQSIINSAVEEPGSYAGKATWDSSISMWVSKIYDKNGNTVGAIGVDANKRTNKV